MFTNGRLQVQPGDLGIILSYQCQSRCAHCLYNCHPHWGDWITPEAVETALIRAKSAWPGGFQVHLTGGEPFLNFPILLESARIARHLGIPAYVETNASWCRSQTQAEKRFRSLKEAGVRTILISVSPFHQAAIPLTRTLTAISAARGVFGPSRVIIYQANWLPELTGLGLEKPVPLSRYTDIYGKEKAAEHLWHGFGLISGGRAAYALGEHLPKRPVDAFRKAKCANELAFARHSHLDLYGNFVPAFCGGITLGDWHNLDEVVSDFRQGAVSPMIKTLLEQGPYGLFKRASAEADYTPLPDGYVGKCHLCVDLRRHLKAADLYAEDLQPEGFYEGF
jgi:hypothetical protein